MIPDSITHFIKEQKVATVCCLDENNTPYCFSCFFSFDKNRAIIYFKSSFSSRHATLLQRNDKIAGTILPDKLNVLAIQGIQFTGKVLPFADALSANASAHYHKKYPFALAMSGDVWTIQLESIKMTDNTKGFGKKLEWNLEPEQAS